MADLLKKGDIAQLKSGGPKMTVDEVTSGGFWCVWFAGAKRERSFFRNESLVVVAEEKSKA